MLAQKFLAAVDQLNADLGIPTVPGGPAEADIPDLARAACHEAHTGYPCRATSQEVCEGIIRQAPPRRWRRLKRKPEAAQESRSEAAPVQSGACRYRRPEGSTNAIETDIR